MPRLIKCKAQADCFTRLLQSQVLKNVTRKIQFPRERNKDDNLISKSFT